MWVGIRVYFYRLILVALWEGHSYLSNYQFINLDKYNYSGTCIIRHSFGYKFVGFIGSLIRSAIIPSTHCVHSCFIKGIQLCIYSVAEPVLLVELY